MATHIVSTSLTFVKQHPFTLCCLLLLFTPPVFRLVLFFTPLLASTALCVLALVSWVPNQGGPNSSDKKLDRLFDETKHGAKKEDRSEADDGCSCFNNEDCERSIQTRSEVQWMGADLLEGSSELDYQERLKEREEPTVIELDGDAKMENPADGEIDVHQLMENSAERRSAHDQTQEVMDLHYPDDSGRRRSDHEQVKEAMDLMHCPHESGERSQANPEQLQKAMDLSSPNALEEVEHDDVRATIATQNAAEALQVRISSSLESEADDVRAATAMESDAKEEQFGDSKGLERSKGEMQQRLPRTRKFQGVMHDNEKVFAKLKMAMEREVAALEASLLSPQMSIDEMSMHCKEEEHLLLPSTEESPNFPIS